MISRQLTNIIRQKFNKSKAIIILGPRQTGKTTLLKIFEAENNKQCLFLDCDDPIARENLENANLASLRHLIGKNRLVIIDEAQRVKNIGLCLKMITDNFKHVQLLVSGSSALELAGEINEPLTGRKWEYLLFPLCWQEINGHYGNLESLRQLETRIIFGMYPDVVTNPGEETEILTQLAGSYMYKDILAMKDVRRPDILEKLLKALALQIGNEVSYNELARLVEVDKKTIIRYIDLLEKTFIVFRLSPLSRNARSEIGTGRKIYFYDNGIRNSIISNYNPLSLRQDTGALWENFLISERMKFLQYQRLFCNRYFWRTVRQQEIDYVEEYGGAFHAFELKWNPKVKVHFPKTFTDAYPDCTTQVVNRSNFAEFLLPGK